MGTAHDMRELSTYTTPPRLIEAVLLNVHLLLGYEWTWVGVRRKTRGGKDFLENLRYFNQHSITEDALRSLHFSFKQFPESFVPELVSKISETTATLCEWVNAVCHRAGVQFPQMPKSPQLKE